MSELGKMKAPPPDFRVLRFWSDAFPANQRLSSWRRIINEMLIATEVESVANQPFQVEANLRILPEFRAGIGFLAPTLMRRTRAIVAADNDDCYLIVNLEGQMEVIRENTTTVLEEGDSGFFSCRQEVNFLRKHGGRLMCLRVGRDRLSMLVSNLDEYSGEIIRHGNASLRLLAVYVRELDHNQSLVSPELQQLVTGHIYDLTALILNSSRDAARLKPGDKQALVRLRAIEKYIAENLGRDDLTIAAVAAAQRLSPRQVQRLFEANDTTFSEYMLLRRLQNVRNALTDPRQVHRSVSEIALANGFGDVSYFNRAFRREYNASPSEVRQSAASPV